MTNKAVIRRLRCQLDAAVPFIRAGLPLQWTMGEEWFTRVFGAGLAALDASRMLVTGDVTLYGMPVLVRPGLGVPRLVGLPAQPGAPGPLRARALTTAELMGGKAP